MIFFSWLVRKRFSEEKLELMYQSDTIDIKNYHNLDKDSPIRQDEKEILRDRLLWYRRMGLHDHEEQLYVALYHI